MPDYPLPASATGIDEAFREALADRSMPLLKAIRWAFQQALALRNPAAYEARVEALEEAATGRLTRMLDKGSDETALAAARVVAELRRVHVEREVAALDYARQCIASVAAVEVARMESEKGGVDDEERPSLPALVAETARLMTGVAGAKGH